jgi:hypothetical protein
VFVEENGSRLAHALGPISEPTSDLGDVGGRCGEACREKNCIIRSFVTSHLGLQRRWVTQPDNSVWTKWEGAEGRKRLILLGLLGADAVLVVVLSDEPPDPDAHVDHDPNGVDVRALPGPQRDEEVRNEPSADNRRRTESSSPECRQRAR